MADLAELLERVRRAEGANDELDVRLHIALVEDKQVIVDGGGYRNERPAKWAPASEVFLRGGWTAWHDAKLWINAGAYSGSIDAALSLVEAKLPGCEWEITNLYGVAQAGLPLNDADGDTHYGRRKDGNIPLAIIEALLTALQQQEGKS
jgi:hypothetical protein